jgi:hypothetical protein
VTSTQRDPPGPIEGWEYTSEVKIVQDGVKLKVDINNHQLGQYTSGVWLNEDRFGCATQPKAWRAHVGVVKAFARRDAGSRPKVPLLGAICVSASPSIQSNCRRTRRTWSARRPSASALRQRTTM